MSTNSPDTTANVLQSLLVFGLICLNTIHFASLVVCYVAGVEVRSNNISAIQIVLSYKANCYFRPLSSWCCNC